MLTLKRPQGLQPRLAALRRRLRLVAASRGLCWLISLALMSAVAAGAIDWRLPGHLPSLVRAVILVSASSGLGYVAYRFLLQPLSFRADNLSMALRVEALYPALNDSLASTVEFLEEPPDSERYGSLALRQVAVQQTVLKAKNYDFDPVVNTGGIRAAGLSLLVATALAMTLLLSFPTLAWTALGRLTNPFGNLEWPRQTQLQIQDYRPRIARGEPYEIRCSVSGVVPEYATIDYQGLSLGRQEHNIVRGQVVARLDRMEHHFRFRVRANDAATGWHEVAVVPPPVLVPLDGRPSPQVRLRYPVYTDLPPLDLPDGSGNIEAVTGTHVSFRAATDRPIAKAWIEYRPEQALVKTAALLGPVGKLDFT